MIERVLLASLLGALVQGASTLWVAAVARGQVALSTACTAAYAAAIWHGVGRGAPASGLWLAGYVAGSALANAAVVARLRRRRGAGPSAPYELPDEVSERRRARARGEKS